MSLCPAPLLLLVSLRCTFIGRHFHMFKPPSLTDTAVSLKRKLKGTVIKEAEGLLRSIRQEAIADPSLADFLDQSGMPASDATREVLSKITDDGEILLGGMTEAQRIVLSKIRDVLMMKGTGMFYFHTFSFYTRTAHRPPCVVHRTNRVLVGLTGCRDCRNACAPRSFV